MSKLAIVYHSGYGHTEKVAEAVRDGATSVAGVEVKLLKSADAANALDELDSFDGIVFGAPTYMGSASAPFKDFMDKTSKKWMKLAWKDKIAAGFTNSGSPSGDKLNTLFQLSVLAAQHGMIWVGQTEVNDGKINRIGSFLGLMAQSDNAPADQTPPPQDLETARRFGARVAKAVLRWNK